MMFDIIAFDADDTLWHNEVLYSTTQEKFKQLLSPYLGVNGVEQRLYETEMRNLRYYGYGIKSFTLSMIETAIELTGGRISSPEIQQIIQFAREMLTAPIQLLAHVEETIERLSAESPLMIITKGDLFDQETKIARSGLGGYFRQIEVVSNKRQETYQALLARYQLTPQRFLMVGNSLRSDILPVVAIGGRAVHIPYHITWVHETVTDQHGQPQDYFELEHMGQLPGLIETLKH